jgi:hypothetical protein
MTQSGKPIPWQKGFLKIPPAIGRALSRIDSNLVVVRTSKIIRYDDLSLYEHVGLTLDGLRDTAPRRVLPPADTGRTSRNNIEGWVVKRTDLPKIIKTDSWDTPNFGDAGTYGWNTHTTTRLVYQVEHFEPPNLNLRTQVIQNNPEHREALIGFDVDSTLDRNWDTFESRLLFHINLLQENVGAIGIFPSDATEDALIQQISLGWEVFPPGTSQALVSAFTKRHRLSPQKLGVLQDRIELFHSLKPKHFLQGVGTFDSYVGAMFADDLVVFENLTYGNALYVLYDDWAEVSKRSRVDLLRGTSANYDRFVHRHGWKDRFKEHIREQTAKRRG